jgi:hypothetical protein
MLQDNIMLLNNLLSCNKILDHILSYQILSYHKRSFYFRTFLQAFPVMGPPEKDLTYHGARQSEKKCGKPNLVYVSLWQTAYQLRSRTGSGLDFVLYAKEASC